MKEFIGKNVGFIQVNKPIVYVDSSYEVACWWEERTSKTGVYPLTLEKADRYSADFNVVAKVPGIITDDYFPALWGGMPISREAYKPKYVGQESRAILVSANLTKAICDTGISPGCDIDWYVNPELWKLFIQNREEELRKAYADLPNWWDKYQAGEDEFHSRVGMVSHIAGHIVQYGREIQELYRQVGYLEEKSDMWRRLHAQNTEWIKKAA